MFFLRFDTLIILSLSFSSYVMSEQAEERKVAIRKLPEQMILSEVRRMVEEMQALNKKLEETVSSQFS